MDQTWDTLPLPLLGFMVGIVVLYAFLVEGTKRRFFKRANFRGFLQFFLRFLNHLIRPDDRSHACTVTFRLPKEAVNGAYDIKLLGDFNDWAVAKGIPMKASKNGEYQVSIDLESGKEYQFRYLLDGKTWENDPQADGYAPTPFGVENSVLIARA